MSTEANPAVWELDVGQKIVRKELHEKWGGKTQGGIGPSRGSKNVFIFTDAAAGQKHGYLDGWGDDGHFHYTGEGQRGDQLMKSGNAAILNHKAEGRSLRLFQGARGEVSYMGEFEIAVDKPFYLTDAPETDGGQIRQVIVFRLRPLAGTEAVPFVKDILPSEPVYSDVPLEGYYTERTVVEPCREPYEAERTESKLVQKFSDHLRSQGHEVIRRKILPAGEAKPLFTDVFVPSQNLLIEAKGSVDRGNIRMAIGQLADYRRFFENVACAILVPQKPREDLLELCRSQNIDLIWWEEKDDRDGKDDKKFVSTSSEVIL